ncbi:zinc ABC transporter substrate-binding protein [Pseudooceanicola sp.]|uniref:metal ABC transporter solute-binding protein, Zn/Mn family n=1 Tax=Pseudooceanicola sp. TaxID=1914328 RepID=UPI00262DD858|nr:zinc ABC transporter substrate-binding protein [Pseudooceanicola sp.]MDF1856649.1 zinc ABC transporter substrate-binding protein [Pseudooceanicola sp.]
MSLTRRYSLSRRQFLASASALPILSAAPLRAAAPLQVVATTGMIADAALAIGGTSVAVRGLMGPGVDPHSYRQTRSDIVAMTRANLVLVHGLYLEAQMEDFFEDLRRRRNVVAVAEEIPRAELRAHATYQDKFDPHVWMDPALWTGPVSVVQRALSAAMPEAAEEIAVNAERYIATLRRLDAYAREVLLTVPEPERVLLTAHDAFGYFGRAYGFEVVGIQGISTESEAGLNRIRDLVRLLVDRRIGAVFVESSVSDRNMRALVEGAAAAGHQVRIGGELFSDAMGVPGTYEGTYPGMIDHNITIIAAALGGKVPPRGMAGLLKGSS